MAGKREINSKGLVRCNRCGELYAKSYRECPFCDEMEEDNQSTAGGRRLRGGGYRKSSPLKFILLILSLAIIATAIWIVCTQVLPLVKQMNTTLGSLSSSQTTEEDTVVETEEEEEEAPATEEEDEVEEEEEPAVESGEATGLTISKTDVTFSEKGSSWTPSVTLTPTGTTATITWSSSNSSVATVTESGRITAVGAGTATITATLSSGASESIIVRCKWTESSTTTTTTTSTSDSGYSLNKEDFTLKTAGETTTLKVTNYTGTVTWSSSNTAIATVSSAGVVTAADSGKGNCIVTATLEDGTTLQAIVRINISE